MFYLRRSLACYQLVEMGVLLWNCKGHPSEGVQDLVCPPASWGRCLQAGLNCAAFCSGPGDGAAMDHMCIGGEQQGAQFWNSQRTQCLKPRIGEPCGLVKEIA